MIRLIFHVVILFFSSVSISLAEVNPYLGGSIGIFNIVNDDISLTDIDTGRTIRSKEKTSDKGSSKGLVGGIIINKDKKINISYLKGKETSSSMFEMEALSLSLDHSFNNSGDHQGWFIGGGVSNLKIKSKDNNISYETSEKLIGPMIRGGYEYKFDNQLFLETGINIHLAKLDQKTQLKVKNKNVEMNTKLDMSNIYFSLSYILF